jgi:hypothetical protein
MTLYCSTALPMYILGNEQGWSLNRTLNYYTILQVGSFCQRASKRDEIPCAVVYTVHNKEFEQKALS